MRVVIVIPYMGNVKYLYNKHLKILMNHVGMEKALAITEVTEFQAANNCKPTISENWKEKKRATM